MGADNAVELPVHDGVWKWAPAVAAGNTVVLKPSELTPSSTFRMAELLTDVLPAGVVNVVCGGPVRTGAAARGGRARHNGRAADLNGAADWISGRCR